jgi:hypothetical protein
MAGYLTTGYEHYCYVSPFSSCIEIFEKRFVGDVDEVGNFFSQHTAVLTLMADVIKYQAHIYLVNMFIVNFLTSDIIFT